MSTANPQPSAAPRLIESTRPVSRNDNIRYVVSAVIALLVLAVVLAPVFLSGPFDGGLAYGSGCVAAASGEKPESKLWWNNRTWSASLFSEKAGVYHIFDLDRSARWRDTGIAIDDRPGSKADVLWDAAAQKLYVASHIFVDVGIPSSDPAQWGRLYRYSYDPAQRSYSLDPGFPVPVSHGASETMVLAKDSTGRLWITFVQGARVMVNHTEGDDRVWGTPYVLPASQRAINLTTDDISSVISFGGNKVGILWSNQLTMQMYFAVHNDGDAPDKWSAEEIAYPDSADDHINLKADSRGNVYAAVKTSFEKKNEPLVLLLFRTPGGHWTNHTFGYVHDHHTRPIILLDEAARTLYMFATAGGKVRGAEAGGEIYYKSSSMDDIDFPPGLGQPFIASEDDPLTNNATSTKQNIQPGMGILVLASDKTTHRYLYNMIQPPGKSLRDR